MGGPTDRAYSLCMSDPAPPTVRVRRDDHDPEPADEPTGPPKVLFWFRLGCVPVAVAALAVAPLALARAADEGWWSVNPLLLFGGCLAVFAAYSLPLWWGRPRWWHWVYSLALLLPGVVPFTNPLTVTLLVFWCRPKTVRYFRTPPDSYAVAPPADETAADARPPGALFALRWMCVIGCGACLLAMPITVAVHAADPDAGWGVLGWLGGFAGAFGLFVVPLFARTPRPWAWWYGLGLLVVCSLSGYFTLLAVPILVAWLLKGTRGHFGPSSTRPRAATDARRGGPGV
jgi:hypothetical protein